MQAYRSVFKIHCFWHEVHPNIWLKRKKVYIDMNSVHCAVPENIHTHLMEVFFKLNPPPLQKFRFSVILSFKKLGFGNPPPLWNFLLNFLGVGMDIFWNYTLICIFSISIVSILESWFIIHFKYRNLICIIQSMMWLCFYLVINSIRSKYKFNFVS